MSDSHKQTPPASPPRPQTQAHTHAHAHSAAESDSASQTPPRPQVVFRAHNEEREQPSDSELAAERERSLNVVEFVPPSEGTPAALALAANAQIKVSKLDRVTHKFRSLKRPKMKSLNIVKKLNKTTKRRQERHFSKNFKGKVIDGVHELYTLTAGMMLGIRYCVGRSVCAPLHSEDFHFVENVMFPPKGNTTPPYITPPHSLAHTFKFKSYAPRVFHSIREFFGIDPASYMMSVCGDYNFLEFISNSKSGQFFFYSHDGKYMLKTQTKAENKFLKQILPQYHAYLQQNPHSFLVRILGMHRIKMYHLRRKVHFVIMTSVFDTPAQIHRIYDLKGSLVGRSATQRERESGGVLKDQDLVDDGTTFRLGKKRAPFLLQLQKDAKFLASLNIMDYSLLVGVHDRDRRPLVGKIDPSLPLSVPAPPPVSVSVSDSLPVSAAAESLAQPAASRVNSNSTTASRTPSQALSVTVTETEREAHTTHPSTHHTHALHSTSAHHMQVNAATGVAEREGEREALSSSLGVRSNTPFRRASATQTHTLSPLPPLPQSSAHTQTHTHDEDRPALTDAHTAERRPSLKTQTLSSPPSPSPSLPHTHTQHNSPTQGGAQYAYSDEESCADGEEHEEEEDASSFDENEVEFVYDEVDLGDSDEEQDREHARNRPHSTPLRPPSSLQGREPLSHAQSPTRAPWTTRLDGGINAHGPAGREREIYFVGVIDILQEYNINKKTETVFKGLTHDVRQISSVDPVTYARRFIQFLEANTE